MEFAVCDDPGPEAAVEEQRDEARKSLSRAAMQFTEGQRIRVVFDDDRQVGALAEEAAEGDVVPAELRHPSDGSLRILHDARHGDPDGEAGRSHARCRGDEQVEKLENQSELLLLITGGGLLRATP